MMISTVCKTNCFLTFNQANSKCVMFSGLSHSEWMVFAIGLFPQTKQVLLCRTELCVSGMQCVVLRDLMHLMQVFSHMCGRDRVFHITCLFCFQQSSISLGTLPFNILCSSLHRTTAIMFLTTLLFSSPALLCFFSWLFLFYF